MKKMVLGEEILFSHNSDERICLGEFTEVLIKSLPKLKGKNILDIGSGSGVIGIYGLLKEASQVTFVDIDKKYLFWAKENLAINQSKNNAIRGTSDFFEGCISKVNHELIAQADISIFSLPQLPLRVCREEHHLYKSFKVAGKDGTEIIELALRHLSTSCKKEALIYMTYSPILSKDWLYDAFEKYNFEWKRVGAKRIYRSKKELKRIKDSFIRGCLIEERKPAISVYALSKSKESLFSYTLKL